MGTGRKRGEAIRQAIGMRPARGLMSGAAAGGITPFTTEKSKKPFSKER